MRADILMLLVLSALLAAVAWREGHGRRVLAFPFLFCASWLAFVMAAFLEFALSGDRLYDLYAERGVTDRAMLMIGLSALSGLLGYALGAQGRRRAAPSRAVPSRRLVRVLTVNSLVIGAISWAAFVLLARLGGGLYDYVFVSGAYGIRWEGAPVYYVFAVRFIYVAIVIQLWLWARTRAPIHLALALILSIIPFINIAFIFRRSEVIVMGAIYGYFLVTYFGLRIGRLGMIAVALAMVVVMRLFPLLRSEEGKARTMSDLIAQALAARESYDNSEIGSALYRIYATTETGRTEFGAIFWNALVEQFLPRALVGDLKADLLLPTVTAFETSQVTFLFYLSPVGFAQAFQQFWYLGALIFLVIGFWAARLERGRRDSPRREIFAVLILPFLVTGVTADLVVLETRIVTYGILVMLVVPRRGMRAAPARASAPALAQPA